MKYWLDLFTGTTWDEFLAHGANVSGFRERRRRTAEQIQPGDCLLCYLTGISRFVGVIEVKSKCYEDKTPIWQGEVFPCRFKVELVHKLTPDTAVPITELRDKLPMFRKLKSPHAWTGFFRGSPAEFSKEDAEMIVAAIKDADVHPVAREYDERQYTRRPKVYETKVGVVTVPENDAAEPAAETTGSPHDEIQYLLLKLGSDMGLDVWVARNDRGRQFNGTAFQSIPNMRDELPRQFDEATNRTIELIDVLWLQGDAIVAAFEVEHTTAIYSGLLRMSDLVSMQPNIKLDLYMVAPDDRGEKVFNEINRPTSAKLKPPLPQICRFIPYSKLKKEILQIGSKVKYLKPDFIKEVAESCEPLDD